jgi:hypothetical protein
LFIVRPDCGSGFEKIRNVKEYALVAISTIIFLVALSSAHRTVSAVNTYHHLSAARGELLSVNRDNPYIGLKFLHPSPRVVRKGLDVLKTYRLSLFRNYDPHANAPVIRSRVSPDTVLRNGDQSALITASVVDTNGTFADSGTVVVDLPWKIMRNQKMYDDGTHGDVTLGDGMYSYAVKISDIVPDVPNTLIITATDDTGNTSMSSTTLSVIEPGAVYMDDSDAELLGSDWICKSAVHGLGGFGNNFCYHMAGDGSSTAVWRPEITEGGSYEVFARWPSALLTRAHSAKYTVYYDGGSDVRTLDQMVYCGQWNYLGTYRFAAGTEGCVILSNDADDYVIADGVKWRRANSGASQ